MNDLKGTVHVYFYVYFRDIDRDDRRKTVTLLRESNVTAQAARGLYLDVQGMNQDKNCFYTWNYDSSVQEAKTAQ